MELTIVQPRIDHPEGCIRSWVVSYEDVIAFAVELMERARATQKPDAPRTPGSWCRFCRAAAICPEKRKAAESVALVEFGALPLDQPPRVETLTPERMGDMLQNFWIVEDYIAAVRAHAFAALNRGETIPGMKLVAKKANRSWVGEAQVLTWAASHGILPKDLHEVKLRSPAQVEKTVLKARKLALPEDLFSKVSSGPTLAPASDPRPALLVGAAHEFGDTPLLTNPSQP
jgi:hypothetical protein